jgi:eukaryotic-like serine/threonine-protein kinase
LPGNLTAVSGFCHPRLQSDHPTSNERVALRSDWLETLLSLSAGTRLGPYEIVDLLGAGGMGEVYRGRDSRLGRDVAIKLLPGEFATDADRLQRFEQEARATARLNHPAILAVYDVGVHEGTPYLVSELLQGATLRERLHDGSLPVAACVDYGAQIAAGLAAAHEQGIVHRDLKPENLFVLPGNRLKILDFGLAKVTTVAGAAADDSLTEFTRAHTAPHTILGTLGYLSPEQARGEPADSRSDIFSFGCVLFEMLEGRRAFTGPTPADAISATLKDAPADVTSSVARPVPAALQIVIRRCLEKDPAARFQSADDLGFVLRSLTSVGVPDTVMRPAESPVPHRREGPRWRWLVAMAVAALVLAALLALMRARLRSDRLPARATEFLLPPPSGDLSFAPMPLPGLAPTAPQVGVSPDGRSIALVTTRPSGQRELWVRALDTSLPRLLERTDGVSSWPFWSPDSRSVVVAIDGTLRKIDVTTGAQERLSTLPPEAPPVPFVTGSWARDTILFSIGGPTGIYAIPPTGGSPRAITQLDKTRHDNYHSWPQQLPDGRFLVFVRTDDAKTTGVYAGSVDSGQLTLVLANASRAVYAAGFLLWAADDRLLGQPFDAASLRLTGSPTTVAPSVYQGAGRTPAFWAAEGATLVYAVGGRPERQFRWFNREGVALGDVGPPALYVSFDLSPDASRVVTEVVKPGPTARSTLSTLDTARGVLTPLTTGANNDSDPRFGSAGDIAFARNSGDSPGLFRMDPNGGHQSLLFPRGKLPVIWMESWARELNAVVFRSGANRDAWMVAGQSPPRRLTQATEPVEQVQLSPDRRWIVYNTQDSGQYEVYVAPVSASGERWQVSGGGGVQGTWGADGDELYYLGLDGGLYIVDVRTANGRLEPGKPRLLFRAPIPVISAVVEQYRPTSDGRRFLFCLPVTSVQREPLRVVLDWPARLAGTNDGSR